MESNKNIAEQIEAAQKLENDGQFSEAAVIYQKLVKGDPTSLPLIRRLLVMYRKLKEYRKELSVLNDAIAAYQQRQKASRDKWIQSHPKAASVGKSMLRELEKSGSLGMGSAPDPVVEGWMKRKVIVSARMAGKKIKRGKKPIEVKKADSDKKASALKLIRTKADEKKHLQEKVIADKKKAAQENREALAREKREEKERIAAEAAKGNQASLFVIILRYLVSLEEIDGAMKQHMAYLDKHFASRSFLVSGRQVPRTGGVIVAHGKDRAAIEKIVKQDPFVKRRLASAEIIEFTASQSWAGLQKWLS